MPFTHRDKPKLGERLRGRSGEELLNEIKSDWDKERRMFFDSPSVGNRPPSSGAFSRGFPFDEDRGRTNIRSYLDEFANRHPEFADQLRGPPWSEEFANSSFNRKRRGSGSGGEEAPKSQASGSGGQQQQQQPPPTTTEHPAEAERTRQGGLNQFGLRNTVPLAQNVQAEEDRRQRSMSAPPDNRAGDKPKRFQSKCEINLTDPEQTQGKTPNPQKTSEPPSQQASQQQPPPQHTQNTRNVRVIPIQVEGRDEPVVNTNIDTSSFTGDPQFREPSFEGRMPRDFGSYQKHSPRFSQERPPTPQQQHQQHQQQQFYQAPPPPQRPPSTVDEPDAAPAPQKAEPPSPISKVEVIQKEVDGLLKEVESFSGNSRADKQYIYLDEMLTRNLIKLDDIETEGKENIRQARKDAIRSIQRCISLLENKAVENKSGDSAASTDCRKGEENQAQETSEQPMEVDKTKENTPVPGAEDQQKMEVEATAAGSATAV